MRGQWKTSLVGSCLLAGMMAGCAGPSKTEVRDATHHISDTAQAGKRAQELCRTPPAGQDPAPLCAAVDQSFDEIKKTSDALGKRAE